MYSAHKLKKQSDNIERWCIPFPILNQSVVPCLILKLLLLHLHTVSQEAGNVVWYSQLFKNFPHSFVIYTVKGFSVVSEAEVDVFLEFPCFLYGPTNVDNLISGSSGFYKSSFTSGSFVLLIAEA